MLLLLLYIFIYNCLVWLLKQTSEDKRRVRTAERIISAPRPRLRDLYTSRVRKRAKKVHSAPLTPSSRSHWTVALWPALESTEHQNDQTQTRPNPTWTHNTPQHCTSVNNSSNIEHIHCSAYAHFDFITIAIHNYCLFSSLLVFYLIYVLP